MVPEVSTDYYLVKLPLNFPTKMSCLKIAVLRAFRSLTPKNVGSYIRVFTVSGSIILILRGRLLKRSVDTKFSIFLGEDYIGEGVY